MNTAEKFIEDYLLSIDKSKNADIRKSISAFQSKKNAEGDIIQKERPQEVYLIHYCYGHSTYQKVQLLDKTSTPNGVDLKPFAVVLEKGKRKSREVPFFNLVRI